MVKASGFELEIVGSNPTTPANNGVCSSVGRALGCDPGCRGFDPHHTPQTCMGDSNGLGSGLQIR